MKRVSTIALTLLLGASLTSCKSQNPQSSSQLPQPPSSPSSSPSSPSIPSPSSPSSSSRPSLPSPSSSPSALPPSGPSLPGGAPPIPSTSSRSGSESSQQNSDSRQNGEQGSPQTAEESYGRRPGSGEQSEEIPDLDAQPSASEAATHEQLLEVLADIDAALEEAANDPSASEAERARVEQYQDVLGDIRVSVENGQLDPAGEQALLDILADLEGSVETSERAQANNGDDIPVTITVEQVAILQDLINVLGIPGATPGIGFPSLPGLPSGGSRTGGETLGDLDAALEASIGVFDGMILSERVNAQGKPGEAEGSEEYTGGAEGLFEEGDVSEGDASAGSQQQAESPQFPGTEENAPQGSQGGGGGIGKAGQHAAIPDDIPDGRDDDIVARQIREAAQNETDPKLREKLWDEYRKYKNGK